MKKRRLIAVRTVIAGIATVVAILAVVLVAGPVKNPEASADVVDGTVQTSTATGSPLGGNVMGLLDLVQLLNAQASYPGNPGPNTSGVDLGAGIPAITVGNTTIPLVSIGAASSADALIHLSVTPSTAQASDGTQAVPADATGGVTGVDVDLTQMLGDVSPGILGGLVDGLSLDVGAVNAHASALPGQAPEGDYNIADLDLTISSPLVEGLDASITSAVIPLTQTLTDDLTSTITSALGSLGPLSSVLKALAGVDLTPKVSVDLDLADALAPVLEGQIGTGTGVVLDLSTGDIIVNFSDLLTGAALNGMPANSQLLSSDVINAIVDGLTADINELVANLTSAIDTAVSNAQFTASINASVTSVLGLPIASLNLNLSGTLGDLLNGTLSGSGNTLGVTLAGASVPGVSVSMLVNAIGGLLGPIINGVAGDSSSPGVVGGLMNTVTSTVLDPVVSQFDPILSLVNSLLGITVNGQNPTPPKAGQEFTEDALELNILPAVLSGDAAVSVDLAQASVMAFVPSATLNVSKSITGNVADKTLHAIFQMTIDGIDGQPLSNAMNLYYTPTGYDAAFEVGGTATFSNMHELDSSKTYTAALATDSSALYSCPADGTGDTGGGIGGSADCLAAIQKIVVNDDGSVDINQFPSVAGDYTFTVVYMPTDGSIPVTVTDKVEVVDPSTVPSWADPAGLGSGSCPSAYVSGTAATNPDGIVVTGLAPSSFCLGDGQSISFPDLQEGDSVKIQEYNVGFGGYTASYTDSQNPGVVTSCVFGGSSGSACANSSATLPMSAITSTNRTVAFTNELNNPSSSVTVTNSVTTYGEPDPSKVLGYTMKILDQNGNPLAAGTMMSASTNTYYLNEDQTQDAVTFQYPPVAEYMSESGQPMDDAQLLNAGIACPSAVGSAAACFAFLQNNVKPLVDGTVDASSTLAEYPGTYKIYVEWYGSSSYGTPFTFVVLPSSQQGDGCASSSTPAVEASSELHFCLADGGMISFPDLPQGYSVEVTEDTTPVADYDVSNTVVSDDNPNGDTITGADGNIRPMLQLTGSAESIAFTNDLEQIPLTGLFLPEEGSGAIAVLFVVASLAILLIGGTCTFRIVARRRKRYHNAVLPAAVLPAAGLPAHHAQ
jgi:hypothetical protein